jgi:hypothetical protein
MIDPLLARLERFEQDHGKVPAKRQKPAHSAKIIVAGASATALLSMVAAMGFQSGTSSANSGTAPVDSTGVSDTPATGPGFTLPLPTVATATPTTPAVQPTLAPSIVAPVTVAPTVPPTAAPVVTQAPVVIPVAVPATPTVKKHRSHTITKSSG